MKILKAYWSRSHNFGDTLTKILLEKLFNVKVEFARVGSAELFGIGSITEYIPDGFSGTVLGTGQMRRDSQLDLTNANVLALRGPLTGDAPVYGDLGLLCSLFAPPRRVMYRMGIVPHFRDGDLIQRPEFAKKGNIEISMLDPFDVVLKRFSACELIVTSALHGIILADALGIPRRWENSLHVYGGGFKFEDYAAGMGFDPPRPGEWEQADGRDVRNKVIELYGAAMEACN